MRDGFAVAVTDIVDENTAAERLSPLKEIGDPFVYIRSDIRIENDRTNALAKILETFGRIDVLVNNAGIAPAVRADVLETSEESFDRVLGVNLKGTFFMTQCVAKYMVKELKPLEGQRTVIVNIASMSAYTVSTNRAEYCISKAGISMVTALFAARLAEYGVYVYEIRPGVIDTDMTQVAKAKYDNLLSGDFTPINRWGKPQDIADAVSMLCSSRMTFSTGDVINVDGGFHLRRL
jgi:NAD(P)-dependent dehydrogenase (short-subunit alcohol dehydrogenase family)